MTRPGTIAITGAGGMLGSSLVRFFLARGWSVRALARTPGTESATHLSHHRADLPDQLDDDALDDVDAVIHGAWATRAVSADVARRTNHDGSRLIVDAARAAGVSRLIFISSLSARADALSEYGRSKHAIEALFDGEHDLSLRPGLVLAPTGGLFGRLRTSIDRSSLVPLFGEGRQTIQTIHVDDLCTAVERVITEDITGTLALAEPDGLPFRDFLAAIAARLGRRLRTLPVPYAPALFALRTAEAFGLRLPVTAENLLGLKSMQHVPTAEDLARLGATVRTAAASLDDLLGSGA